VYYKYFIDDDLDDDMIIDDEYRVTVVSYCISLPEREFSPVLELPGDWWVRPSHLVFQP